MGWLIVLHFHFSLISGLGCFAVDAGEPLHRSMRLKYLRYGPNKNKAKKKSDICVIGVTVYTVLTLGQAYICLLYTSDAADE